MIKTFKHKGLKDLFENGASRRVNAQWHSKILLILDRLEASVVPEDMNLPGMRFHSHQGKPKRYSVDVTGNYRILFEWEDEQPVKVDLVDPH